ncbi:ABC-type polysaccharide/polyol phosphate export permease [Paracoccus aminovorans]|uniref:ABC-type polysaccharide/polyol phosphate export permease n=1 Tax=Paracoccus aminovorans TaxID=34004 RepID=A0A1I3B0Q1_9RHOB|nr:ABC transporter [Paracoccus aminovorans]CQR85247.1 ABC transporter permease [Paracoccus aminovorans]SFH55750.1 ABC-type polysaccharide/polyol phosphate export permease [Paracoccus aminovorans]
MFSQRRNRNMVEAAFTTLALIYHVTVNNLRKGQRNAVVALVMTVAQAMAMIAGFWLMFTIIGVRRSPIRGDFIVYIMTGIFMFMAHSQAIGAVSNAGSPSNQMMKHGPMNTAVMITAAALATLYKQTFSAVVVLTAYNYLVEPILIDKPLQCYAMLLLAWFSGCCIGLIFLSIRPWWPQAATVMTQFYQRINMVFSGKMFVANTMPGFMLHMFTWNPLFHIIDQTRGFAFINYSPRNSSLTYPVYATLALLMIGLMAEFVTRRAVSLSWSSGR